MHCSHRQRRLHEWPRRKEEPSSVPRPKSASGLWQGSHRQTVGLIVMSFTDERLLFLRLLMLRGHRLLRTPYADGAHTFLPTVKLYVIARGQRGQNRRLQHFAGGGSGLTATRIINRRVDCMSFADGRLFFLRPLMPRGTFFFGRAKKKAKNSPGMRFPVPDSRRIGKSHIPGSATST